MTTGLFSSLYVIVRLKEFQGRSSDVPVVFERGSGTFQEVSRSFKGWRGPRSVLERSRVFPGSFRSDPGVVKRFKRRFKDVPGGWESLRGVSGFSEELQRAFQRHFRGFQERSRGIPEDFSLFQGVIWGFLRSVPLGFWEYARESIGVSWAGLKVFEGHSRNAPRGFSSVTGF